MGKIAQRPILRTRSENPTPQTFAQPPKDVMIGACVQSIEPQNRGALYRDPVQQQQGEMYGEVRHAGESVWEMWCARRKHKDEL